VRILFSRSILLIVCSRVLSILSSPPISAVFFFQDHTKAMPIMAKRMAIPRPAAAYPSSSARLIALSKRADKATLSEAFGEPGNP
jgi:hypothetical protein